MNVKTFSECQNLHINVKENLFICSWEKTEIEVQFPEELDYEQIENSLNLSCNTDLILSVPENSKLIIERTGGNCIIKGKISSLIVAKISGNLDIESIINSEIIKVGGNCNIDSIEESIQLGKIGGNCRLNRVSGKISLEKIGGNLSIIGTNYYLDCKAGGNIHIQIDDFLGDHNTINAGGNINLQIAQGNNLELKGTVKGHYELAIGGDHVTGSTGNFQKTLGSGQKSVIVLAGGSLKISKQGENSLDDLEKEKDNSDSKPIHVKSPEISIFEKKIKDGINNVLDKFLDKDFKKLEGLENNENLAGLSFSDQKITTEKSQLINDDISQSESKEEKLIVLKMLQDKKITAKEADRLLQALEQS